ncbi:M20/M25/M40 family metallo-hydrolase [Dictyobacter formicarum]|uniref:Peptidase M20 n=1 Tax=Dictyobacter formicarum TaxID=2778368 RepID=A0ABQ3VKN4_9CHLR|nr:M20/M25/M40 family metallo-hydrolase [Dictyobacter formicarum]GHO86780.1 peptidase M20 [Dictyobacter formicarum]
MMPSTPELPTTYLAAHADEAIDLLTQLCQQPSIAAQNYGIEAMTELTERLLSESGFQTQRLYYTSKAPPAVYGELRGSGPYTLLLYNHYDVQPAEPLDLWHSPPFEPTVREEKFFARGAVDNKGEIAARLAAIRALRATYGELPITLRWIIEGEEEIGSPHFEEIAEKYTELLQADGCLWEGAGFTDEGHPSLNLGTKGLLYVQLDVQGVGIDAHSGKAPILPSAAWRLVQALASLRTPAGQVRIPGFYAAVKSPTEAQLAALMQQENKDEQLKAAHQIEQFVDGLSGVALRERAAFAPTCNIAGLNSGYTGEGVKTVLPARAMAKIDFRLVPDQDPHEILALLRGYLHEQGYDDINLSVLGAAAPVVTPIDDPFVQKIQRIAEAFANKPASISPIVGGSLPLLDALKRHVGLPGLSAPGNVGYWGSGAHAPNEHIRLADLERAVRYNCYMFMALGDNRRQAPNL